MYTYPIKMTKSVVQKKTGAKSTVQMVDSQGNLLMFGKFKQRKGRPDNLIIYGDESRSRELFQIMPSLDGRSWHYDILSADGTPLGSVYKEGRGSGDGHTFKFLDPQGRDAGVLQLQQSSPLWEELLTQLHFVTPEPLLYRFYDEQRPILDLKREVVEGTICYAMEQLESVAEPVERLFLSGLAAAALLGAF